jgi:hypothetical protein
VALIAGAVVIGVVLLSSAEPFQTATDGDRRATTTTAAAPSDRPDAVDPDDGAAVERRNPSEYGVVVANGSGVAGAAGRVSDRLAEGGFQVLPPTNADRVETSVLYALDGFDREAAEVAALLDPMPAIEPMPDEPPADLGGASLLLVVAPDLAEATG